jgi:hypothetical protein
MWLAASVEQPADFYLFLPQLENPDGAERDAGDGRVAPQLRVRVAVPPAHVIPEHTLYITHQPIVETLTAVITSEHALSCQGISLQFFHILKGSHLKIQCFGSLFV